jgi:hypothetical protein
MIMKKKPKKKIGKYLVSKGLLSIEEEKAVATIQEKLPPEERERFGKIAVEVGFIKEEALKKAMQEKREEEKG